jgi:hypothetical protein
MNLLWITLLVLSPAILYGIALLFFGVYRRRCRQCNHHGLRTVGSYKWDGEHGGGVVWFYLCEKCGAHFKQTASDWSEPSDEEWKQHVKVVA